MPEEVLETPQPIEQKSTDWPKIILAAVLGLGLLAGAAYAGYWYGIQQVQPVEKPAPVVSQPTPKSTPTPTPEPTTPSTPIVEDETKDWKTYTDSKTSLTFNYPKDWTVSKQGSETNPWIDISSPDKAEPGAQAPSIGMGISLQLFERFQPVPQDDLQRLVKDEGVLKHYKVRTIKESFETVSKHPAFSYEYEGTESPYSFHFWGVNVARGKTIISLLITDFKADTSLNTQEIANQILSTFKFLD